MSDELGRVIELYEEVLQETRDVAQRLRDRLEDLRARYPEAGEAEAPAEPEAA
jgi:BMFP domain-containing protein YqiC